MNEHVHAMKNNSGKGRTEGHEATGLSRILDDRHRIELDEQENLAGDDQHALRHAAIAPAALCTIVGIDGSFSRRCGAQLAIGQDGGIVGSLADSCLEAELANQASIAWSEGKARLLRYGRGSPYIDIRLPCGGGLDVLIDPFPDQRSLQEAVDRIDARAVTGIKLALPEHASPGLLTTRCYLPPLRIAILGAGPECWALKKLAAAFGIDAIVLGPETGLALGREPTSLRVDRWTALVMLFHDHDWEDALLKWALQTPAFFIGAQGGAGVREARRRRLVEAGYGLGEIARINGPIGVIPHARDPGVLALSVLAQVVDAYQALHPHP